MAHIESAAMEVSAFPSRRFEVYGTKGSFILEPLEPKENPTLRLCLSEPHGNYTKGWQTIGSEIRPRYDGEIIAFVDDIRGKKSPDRSLYHELIVQETVLRASMGVQGFLLLDDGKLLK